VRLYLSSYYVLSSSPSARNACHLSKFNVLPCLYLSTSVAQGLPKGFAWVLNVLFSKLYLLFSVFPADQCPTHHLPRLHSFMMPPTALKSTRHVLALCLHLSASRSHLSFVVTTHNNDEHYI
jgi:hypothetical protein